MKSPFPKSTYERNAATYKVLANPVRLEILNMLKQEELSVEDLTAALGLRKANVSQHLSLLRAMGIVTTRRDGLRIHYTLVHKRIVEPCAILHSLWEELAHHPLATPSYVKELS